ncbi:hypothetical protein AAFF_G00171870 [Aldrovandia affinis]|uniref:Uncharacterized protein n=1 Tax=Aldrovandia affinis TaxID=143900 RepID=A0AAD7SYL8_9TELE|nr:hypothetical protein AAFF_G00171870 [Aldrovandia affinis]
MNSHWAEARQAFVMACVTALNREAGQAVDIPSRRLSDGETGGGGDSGEHLGPQEARSCTCGGMVSLGERDPLFAFSQRQNRMTLFHPAPEEARPWSALQRSGECQSWYFPQQVYKAVRREMQNSHPILPVSYSHGDESHARLS